MESKALIKIKDQPADSISAMQVYIAGQPRLQNTLLAKYFEEKAGLRCVCKPSSEVFPIHPVKKGQKFLILWDCMDSDMDELWSCMFFDSAENISESFVVLFNVKRGLGIENKAMQCDVRGIFYENDPPEILTKGVQAVLNGELWFSRRIMTRHFLDNRAAVVPPQKVRTTLTPREKEVLCIITAGATNEEIVKKLFISPHTVRTHLYNIFKKIQVSNRTQAALWGTKNL